MLAVINEVHSLSYKLGSAVDPLRGMKMCKIIVDS